MEPDDGALTMTQDSHAALFVVDMLNDFLAGPFAGPGAERLIEPVRTAVDRARAHGVPVIFICGAYAPDDVEFAVLPPHAIAGTLGVEIVSALAPSPSKRSSRSIGRSSLRTSSRHASRTVIALRWMRCDVSMARGSSHPRGSSTWAPPNRGSRHPALSRNPARLLLYKALRVLREAIRSF